MTSVRFGLRHPPCRPAVEMAAFAAQVERAGFDMAWFPDSQFLWREVWTTLALVAAATDRIGIGTAVTNFETRHVSVTAAAASTIEELAPRRLRIAVGTGDSSIKTLGLSPTRLSRMREQIDVLRRLLAGETVVYGEDGDYAGRRMHVNSAPGRALPVYMAASGPRALALAGEVADGVILLAGIAPSLIEAGLAHIRSGAERAGRRLEDIDVWLAAHTIVADDRASAARMVKPLAITSAQLGAGDALRSVGIDIDVPKVVPGVYPDVTHADDWDAAIAAAERYVDDAAADRYARNFTLAGTVDDVVDRITRAVELGISGFYIQGPLSYELPVAQLEAFRDVVIPRFRQDMAAACPAPHTPPRRNDE